MCTLNKRLHDVFYMCYRGSGMIVYSNLRTSKSIFLDVVSPLEIGYLGNVVVLITISITSVNFVGILV